MKNLIILFSVLLACSCKVIDDPIDTGICESNTDLTMWEYLNRSRQWDSIVRAIEYAGIKTMFDGTDPQYRNITFLGTTNYCIIAFLIENGYESITDLTPKECKTMLLSHMISGKVMKNDCDYEVKGTNDGGTITTSLTGKKIRLYRIKTGGTYGPESGPQFLAIHALKSGFKADVVSADIEVKNGVVHSLSTSYVWTEL